jgi:hypothetical protein
MIYRSQHTNSLILAKIEDKKEKTDHLGAIHGMTYLPFGRANIFNGSFDFHNSASCYTPLEKVTLGLPMFDEDQAGRLFFTKYIGRLVILVSKSCIKTTEKDKVECYTLYDPNGDEPGTVFQYFVDALQPAPKELKFELINPFFKSKT